MNRIIRNIQDQRLFSRLEGESIIVSESLAPADTVIFSRNQVLGYATDLGGVTSHAALLSRSLKIPAVVGLRSATKHIQTGDFVAVDGYAGTLTINPRPLANETMRHCMIAPKNDKPRIMRNDILYRFCNTFYALLVTAKIIRSGIRLKTMSVGEKCKPDRCLTSSKWQRFKGA